MAKKEAIMIKKKLELNNISSDVKTTLLTDNSLYDTLRNEIHKNTINNILSNIHTFINTFSFTTLDTLDTGNIYNNQNNLYTLVTVHRVMKSINEDELMLFNFNFNRIEPLSVLIESCNGQYNMINKHDVTSVTHRANNFKLFSDSINNLYNEFYNAGLVSSTHINNLINSFKLNLMQQKIQISDIENKTKEVHTRLDKSLSTSENTLKQIQKLENESRESIENIIRDSNTYTFFKRSKELDLRANTWLVFSVLLGVIAAAIFTIFMKDATETHNFWRLFTERSIYISITVLALVFTGKQYAKERNLEEQYRFKAITLQSASLIKEVPQNKEVKEAINLIILNQVLSKLDSESSKEKNKSAQGISLTTSDIIKIVTNNSNSNQ